MRYIGLDVHYSSSTFCILEKNGRSLLNGIGHSHPGVILLRTIPGVGIRTAETVVAYMDNPRKSEACGADRPA